MNKVKVFTLLTLFFIFSFSVNAYNYYGSDNTYLGGSSTFNEDANFTIRSASITDIVGLPLTADIDNDGVFEIVVLTTTGFTIYDSQTLIKEKSHTFPAGDIEGDISAMTLADLDDDDLIDIIISSNIYDINIMEWDGSNLQDNVTFSNVAIDSNTESSYLGCDDDRNLCAVLYAKNDGSNSYLRIIGFNRSQGASSYDGTGLNGTSLYSFAGNTETACLSNIKQITIADYDGDTFNEFIVSWLRVTTSDEYVKADYIHVLENLSITIEQRATWNLGESIPISAGEDKCITLEYYKAISPALVVSIDSVDTSKLETLIVAPTSTGEESTFDGQIIIFDDEGAFLDSHPEILQIEYDIVGNIAYGNFFSGQTKDYCAGMFSTVQNRTKFFCGSRYTGNFLGLDQDTNFVYSTGTDHNTEVTFNRWNNVINTIEALGDNSRNEILSDLGVTELIDSTETARLLYQNVYQNSMITPVNTQGSSGVTTEDLIILDGNNLWYLDDSLTNYGCNQGYGCIEQIYFDPDNTQTWKTNSSVEIRLKITDFEGDHVSGRIVLYANDTNAQDSGWTGNVSSGATLVFTTDENSISLIANKSGNGFKILLMARDIINPSSVQVLERYFSVNDDYGIVKGDATITEELLITGKEDPSFEDVNINYNDNLIAELMKNTSQKANITVEILVLLLAIIVGASITFGSLNQNYSMGKSMAYGLTSALFVIFGGAIFKLISVAWIIVPIVISIGALIIGKIVFGGSDSN